MQESSKRKRDFSQSSSNTVMLLCLGSDNSNHNHNPNCGCFFLFFVWFKCLTKRGDKTKLRERLDVKQIHQDNFFSCEKLSLSVLISIQASKGQVLPNISLPRTDSKFIYLFFLTMKNGLCKIP